MSYLVLARKYRPRTFDEMVGQEHVLKALINALDSGDLHHAYLFTGTRGVGKTTIARIFAKCLNNPSGITASPDLNSDIARKIDLGEFIDLLEVDAASRTKVEQTRELLENIHYPPSHGRFRVYLIDEVHMLSTHSFNALLKTLEEPPEHVKFLLATTDPQKLPVTVVSRCLQFHLKQIPIEQIEQQLTKVLDKEGIEHDSRGVRIIAKAGQGSLRDALSILDQAIAYTNRSINGEEIASFLGVTDRTKLASLIEAIVAGEANAILKVIGEIDKFFPNYQQLLDDILLHFQQAAITQQVTDHIPDEEDVELVRATAQAMSPEQIQLYYQIALRGKHELEIVTNQKSALEMIVLRMLAFAPAKKIEHVVPTSPSQHQHLETKQGNNYQRTISEQQQNEEIIEQSHFQSAQLLNQENWLDLYSTLELEGFARQIMGYSELVEVKEDQLTFLISEQHKQLLNDEYKQQIKTVLEQTLQIDKVYLKFKTGDQPPERSPLLVKKQQQQKEKQQQQNQIEQDPELKELVDQFDATIVDTSAVNKP